MIVRGKNHLRSRLVLIVFATLLVFSFQNCGVQQPSVDLASRTVAFSHENLKTTCVSCHDAVRPTTIVGNPSFDHTIANYGGRGDCVSCHVAGAGVAWTGGTFAHAPQPVTCIGCHAGQKPTTIINGFNHATQGNGDCVGCHSSVSVYTSMSGWAGTGQTLPSVLVGGRTLSLSVGLPTFLASTISAITTTTSSLKLQMLHSSSQVPGTMLSNCTSCHATAASGNYTNGLFHASLTTAGRPQPTACLDCHAGASPVGFVGPVQNSRVPASGKMAHEATRWIQTNGVWNATTTQLVTQDCTTCHKTPGSVWSSANYHSNLVGQQPNSCLACHANSRPTGSVGTPAFNHATNGGLGDCVSCHSSTSVWSGGNFPHAGVTSCSSCHESQRPISSSGWATAGWTSTSTTFNLATHGGVSNDCYSCHSGTTTFNTMANWAGGHKNHSPRPASCNSCHNLPSGVVGTTPTFDHSFAGATDCNTCHTTNSSFTNLTGWAGGQFAHNPQPATCISCHTGQRPSVVVNGFSHATNGMGDCVGCHNTVTNYNTMTDWVGTGQAVPTALVTSKTKTAQIDTPVWLKTLISSITTSAQVLPLQFLHTSAQIPASFYITDVGTGAVSLNCVTCHAQAGSGNFSGGSFHPVVTNAGQAQPATCLECHTAAKPNAFSGLSKQMTRVPASRKMPHDATTWAQTNGVWAPTTTKLVTQDCATCHKSPGGVFASANYHSNLSTQPSSCLACHANSRPSGSVGSPPFNHANNGGLGDCVSCHSSTSVWSGGQFPHSGVTSCSSCHESQRPTNTTGWVTGGWNQSLTTFNLTTHGGATNDCYSCHASTTIFNTMANWAGGHKNHSPKPATCVECHMAPTGAVGSTLFNHVNIGTQDCLGCHTTNSNYTSLSGWAGAAATPAGLVNANATSFAWASVIVNPTTIANSANLGTLTSTTQTNVKLPLQMLHSSPAVAAAGINISSCASCHTVGFTANSGTKFHASLTRLGKAQPTANCTTCHAPGAVPVGIVGPKTGATDITKNMNHAATSVTECSVCHSSPGTVGAFKTAANFHANVSATTVTSCTSCHAMKTPSTLNTSTKIYTSSTGLTYPQHFMHKSTMVAADCVSCHLQKGPGPVNPWITSVKAHSVLSAASLSRCNDCHSTDIPGTTVWYPSSTANNRYLHTSTYGGNNDCQTCHTKQMTSPYTNLATVGVTWNGGVYNHLQVKTKDKTSTCVACHTGTSGGFYNHSNFGSKSTKRVACMMCHGTAPF